jgi:hypothetical protein
METIRIDLALSLEQAQAIHRVLRQVTIGDAGPTELADIWLAVRDLKAEIDHAKQLNQR